MAQKDPTVTTASAGDAYPEGTHPIAPLSKQDWSVEGRFSYKDNPDKPDPSSVAQVVEDKLDQ